MAMIHRRGDGLAGRGGRLRRAVQWDLRLPRPLLLLLLVDLLLLLPIPFLLPALRDDESPRPAAVVSPALPPLLPLLGAPPGAAPAARLSAEAPSAPPLLIAPLRLQHSPQVDANLVAALLGELAPEVAAQQIDVGGLRQSAANVLTGQALRWNLNPLVLLALLESQSGLLSAAPTTDTLDFAMRGPQPGLGPQIGWAARELRQGLLEPISPSLRLADGALWPTPAGIDQGNYALLRFLALGRGRDELAALLAPGPGSWLAAARPALGDPRAPASARVDDAAFLRRPFAGAPPASARFDHRYPLAAADGLMAAADALDPPGYDGHNGWDYALPAGAPVLAAAAGRVLFAGWIDSDCATPAGVAYVQHPNGYRTTYWHLQRIDAAAGDAVAAGDRLGLAGASGCAETPHLHFGVQRLGRDVDPAGWCAAEADPWAGHPAGAASRWLWRDQADACPLPAGALLADDDNPAAALVTGAGWRSSPSGSYGHARWALAPAGSDHQALWRPLLPAAGVYQVYAFIPGAAREAGTAEYLISHAGGSAAVSVDQGRHAGSWLLLGSYRFLAGQGGRVALCACSGAPGRAVWVDALALVPQAAAPAPSGFPAAR